MTEFALPSSPNFNPAFATSWNDIFLLTYQHRAFLIQFGQTLTSISSSSGKESHREARSEAEPRIPVPIRQKKPVQLDLLADLPEHEASRRKHSS